MKKMILPFLLFFSMQLSAQSINIASSTATFVPGGVNVNIQGIGYTLLGRLGHTYSIENNQINIAVCYYVTPLTMIDDIDDNYFIPTNEVREYTINLTIYTSVSETACDYNQVEYGSTFLNLDAKLPLIAKNIQLFPNPTRGIVQIDSGDLDIVAMKIYDLGGKLLMDTNLALVDLSDFENGIYIVTIITEDAAISKKILLQK